MSASITTYLKDLSYSYYLKKSSDEIAKINTSKTNLLNNLNSALGYRIKRSFVFGSYDRDTILPRSVDSNSDIDVMVIFNHTEYERTPETYRNWLKTFADNNYKSRYGSDVVKSFPTVTIRLGNIHFDLVPAKEETWGWSSSNIYIPDKSYGWQSTDPSDVKTRLTDANTRFNQIVKPIIRLLKAWNSTKGYPFDSYELELAITDMNFSGDNIESGFFYAVNSLPSSWRDPQTKQDKINSLRYNIENVKNCLARYDINSAKSWLHRVLPYA
ncbi:nucleotidyltransferase domain-containing protein [Marinoscillum sp. 108]|uniref:SMODS domain-containing nucleotidyltransferase n=1 Tax=Marinoscillum sp. 108 TaxID=2653151 RepID=UPI0012F281A8|nr:nucleotidyltransferase domain-containing protein [Marinoscillum sp. 108]VXD15847.1 Nucleotidyltransferase [Marinoscillum sp. 108]